MLEAIRAAHDRGATLYAHCSAAFELGAAGLLDGRECTTHWRYTDLMARTFPEAKVKPDVLYCHDGNVLTGAGSAAGIDASLHLLRDLYGARVAATTARRIVVPPHRDGGQAQFIARAVPDCDAETLGPLLEWIVGHLDEDLDVDTLARKSLMSPRTFARRFRAETGATPHSWVTQQRVLRAEELLEQSDRSVEWIASEVGFGNAATLRHHFTRSRGVSPQQYRRTFRPGRRLGSLAWPAPSSSASAARRAAPPGCTATSRPRRSATPGSARSTTSGTPSTCPRAGSPASGSRTRAGSGRSSCTTPTATSTTSPGCWSRPTIRLTADITPGYAALPAERLAMIRAGFESRGVRPAAVYLLRDPVERIWSAARMDMRAAATTRPRTPRPGSATCTSTRCTPTAPATT